MGMAAIFAMWPRCHEQTFVSPYPLRLHIKFGFDLPSGYGEDALLTTNGRLRTDAGAWEYYKLTPWAWGSGELIKEGQRLCKCYRPGMYAQSAVHIRIRMFIQPLEVSVLKNLIDTTFMCTCSYVKMGMKIRMRIAEHEISAQCI